jgi:valyl-tRNA synthetase
MEVISKLRDCRNQNGLKMKDSIPMYIEDNDSARKLYAVKGLKEMVIKMSNLTDLIFTKEEVANSVSFLAGTEKYFIESNKTVDVAAERERISTDLEYQKGFVTSVQKKLSNERFVSGAPAVVVDKEKQKLADGLVKMKLLEEALSNLG